MATFPTFSIPVPGIDKTFEVPSFGSLVSEPWSFGPNRMDKAKKKAAQTKKKQLKKLRKRGKQHN
jgi:hypothetical protein